MRESAVRHIPANFAQIANNLAGQPVKKRKVVSLFSGCGGMDLGFMGGFPFGSRYYDVLPYDIVWANDLNASACATYEANLQHAIHAGDIADVMDTMPKRADVVIGGFPCRDVSINGSKAVANGERTILYRSMIDVIERTKPLAFVAENVKGMLQSHARDFFDRMITEFEDTGYKVTHKVYLAADFGVPQMRERVIIVGTKRRPFAHPDPEFKPSDYITAKAAIADLEGEPENSDTAHIWSKAARSPEQGDRRLKADRPSTTIRAEHHGNVQWHYSLPRRLSLREAARLQSFPDAFTFEAGMRETERQIGNAVPPVMAWHIAKALREHLDSVVAELTDDLREDGSLHDPDRFQQQVRNRLRTAFRADEIGPVEGTHPHAFPDITLNGYGVEVKFTKKDTWLSVGNSVFEGMRTPGVDRIHVIFGKAGGSPEVRWARYDECVTHVRVSHAPRFVVEMDTDRESLFDHMQVPYAEFCLLTDDEKMEHIREYSRGRLRTGERLWWLEDQHALPMQVRLYMRLTMPEKRMMRAEAALLCPQICRGSRARNKYNDAALYLLTHHGVFCPQTRDLFSAGSVAGSERGGNYLPRALQDIEDLMRDAARRLDGELFVEYWGEDCPPDQRIAQWLERADAFAIVSDWTPSEVLFLDG